MYEKNLIQILELLVIFLVIKDNPPRIRAILKKNICVNYDLILI